MNLDDLEFMEASSSIEVSLQTLNGTEITSSSDLQPNTTYNLVIKSGHSLEYKFKKTDGFTVDDSKNGNREFDKKIFKIRTNEEVTPNLYFSLVPLQTIGNNYVKEKPQNFLIPNN